MTITRPSTAAGNELHIEVEADGFLYNMVRNIVGTLVEVGRGAGDEAWPARARRRRPPHRRAAGAAAGLTLVSVDYSMRIAHIITRLILGGAQENTLLTCEGLLRRYGDDVLLVTGPAVGPEGSLIERGRAGGCRWRSCRELRRSIHPWHDLIAIGGCERMLGRFPSRRGSHA